MLYDGCVGDPGLRFAYPGLSASLKLGFPPFRRLSV